MQFTYRTVYISEIQHSKHFYAFLSCLSSDFCSNAFLHFHTAITLSRQNDFCKNPAVRPFSFFQARATVRCGRKIRHELCTRSALSHMRELFTETQVFLGKFSEQVANDPAVMHAPQCVDELMITIWKISGIRMRIFAASSHSSSSVYVVWRLTHITLWYWDIPMKK